MRRLSLLDWLPSYRLRDLPRDLFAGTMGTISTAPEAMAFALLAGLPAQMGLYSLLLPLVVYFLLGTSREMSIAPTGTLAAVLAATVAPHAIDDPARYGELAILFAFLVGAILGGAGLLRLGYVSNFVSRPVLQGYLLGAALLIVTSQLGVILGVEAEGLNLPSMIASAVDDRERLHLASALLGLGSCGLLAVLHGLGLGAIASLLVVAMGTAAVALFDLQVGVVGSLQAGLPSLHLPPLGHADAARMLPGAFAAAMLIFLDSGALARRFANERGYRIDPDRELLALGAANAAAGITGAAAVSGNLADSVLLEEAGARSPMTGVVTAVQVLAFVIVGVQLPNVPLAAFAAIVIGGVLRAVDPLALVRIWRFDRAEFAVALVCLAGVLGIGLIRGLLLALGLTTLVLLRRASHPRMHELGLVGGEAPALADRQRVPDAKPLPGALLFQPLGGLFFASASAVTDRIRAGAQERDAELRWVVLDLRAVTFVDLTACDLLEELRRDLASRDIRLLAVRPTETVEEKLRRYGLLDALLPPGGTAAIAELLGLPSDVGERI